MAQTVLFNNHRSCYYIVVPQQPTEVEMHAAEQLQHYIELCSGAKLPIENENEFTVDQPAIFVGCTRWADAELLRDDELRDDGYLLMTDDDNLYLYGKAEKSVLYAAYHFLEHWLGFRLYTPTALYVPKMTKFVMPEINEVCNPSFAYRETLYYYPNQSQLYADWHALHNRADLNRDWGMFVHTFRHLIPTDRYFESHPEWFSEINGRRVKDGQLCLSNPALLEEMCKNLDSIMKLRPEATIWSVSNNDNYNVCTCPECLKMDSLYGGPSGTLVHYINQVAARFPDKTISTLGYQFTRKAPTKKVKPLPNVNIMFCSIECGREEAIATAKGEASFRDDMRNWAALTDNIFMWDYIVQFRSMMNPFPNLHVLQPNLKFFHDNGVRMMFEQATGTGNKTSWMELRTYLVAKLMWNVDANVDSIAHDFCKGYYGPAYPYIEEFFKEMETSLIKSGKRLDIYGYPISGVEGYLSPEQIKKYQSLMAQAYDAVKGESKDYYDRVRYLELSLDYAILELAMSDVSPDLTFFVGPNREINQSMINRADRFVKDCDRFGVESLVEMGRSPEQFRADIDNFIRKSSRENLALNCPVTLTHQPKEPYLAGGAKGLTDGVCGLLNYNYNWLGFYGKPLEAVIDLGKKQEVHEIGLDFFFLPLSWIFVPEKVEFYTSKDGKKWKLQGEVKGHNPEELARPDIHNFRVDGFTAKARYVKIVATPLPSIPDWHRAVGNPCWIFSDEIVVR